MTTLGVVITYVYNHIKTNNLSHGPLQTSTYPVDQNCCSRPHNFERLFIVVKLWPHEM